MADTPPPLAFDTAFTPEAGRPVTVLPGVVRVTAGNAGPYTFTGTNSFILGDSRLAVRSQYWMLGVMVGFTSLALWLLAQAGA